MVLLATGGGTWFQAERKRMNVTLGRLRAPVVQWDPHRQQCHPSTRCGQETAGAGAALIEPPRLSERKNGDERSNRLRTNSGTVAEVSLRAVLEIPA